MSVDVVAMLQVNAFVISVPSLLNKEWSVHLHPHTPQQDTILVINSLRKIRREFSLVSPPLQRQLFTPPHTNTKCPLHLDGRVSQLFGAGCSFAVAPRLAEAWCSALCRRIEAETATAQKESWRKQRQGCKTGSICHICGEGEEEVEAPMPPPPQNQRGGTLSTHPSNRIRPEPRS